MKLLTSQIFGFDCLLFLSLVVPANMILSQGNAMQVISTFWIKMLCKTRNRTWPCPLESVSCPLERISTVPDSSGHERIPMEKAMFYAWETNGCGKKGCPILSTKFQWTCMDSDGKEGCLILSTRFQWTPTEQIPTWKRGWTWSPVEPSRKQINWRCIV